MRPRLGFFGFILPAIFSLFITWTVQPAQSDERSPLEQFNSLTQEYQTAQREFSKIYQEAKTDAEREKAMEKYPQPATYTDRFLALAEKHPQSPVAIDALIWVVQNGRFGSSADKALETLIKDHIQSDKLVPVCQVLAHSDPSKASSVLRKILEANPSREVRGQACLSLGQALKNQGNQAEAEKYLEQVVQEYSDLKWYRGTLGDQAKSELFELRNLAIGKVAPEIEGEDLDGNKFKLSDYRGKVVVIDFWGDW
jgi:tetratricopeptide (TPR) repeat protein